MTGLQQSLHDLKLHITTDKRIWSASAFVCIVFFVWFVTGAWREPEPEPPEKYVRIKVEEEKVNVMIKDFNKDLREAEEERKFLKDYLTRVTEQVKVEKEEIDWHVDVLVNKLNDMTERIDGIALKVGASAVETAELENRLKQQKAARSKKKAVDRSTL
ncbi:MAG: hypothetical protein KDD69_17390 [Bdellovibrionales bacterium]|nr:hypothetical protein [Bdellovibrionales bacterium]